LYKTLAACGTNNRCLINAFWNVMRQWSGGYSVGALR